MLNKDKVFLFERYSLYSAKKIISKINKRKLIKSSISKTEYSNTLIDTYKVNYIRRWVISLLSVISKKGSNIKYSTYIGNVLSKIKQKYNLFNFFSIIEENLTIVFNTFKKRIAGKNLLIPIGLTHYKRVNAMSKLIITSLKLRKERSFSDKLYNELIDAYNNKGLSIIKKLNYTKQLKDVITNIRFLNEKY
uniref:Ribosomal protein small subunit 7 n=1 Tax=Paramoeba pemaquidensis TaxID=180228 RepID=A0A1D8D5I3_9EUKA|nr:ribosomal protein small subunit 7 [Paramoeba pemaquidensis]AOS85564.1 ribosomal protein small subunit 7 [Paramoeba pemaquidensis]